MVQKKGTRLNTIKKMNRDIVKKMVALHSGIIIQEISVFSSYEKLCAYSLSYSVVTSLFCYQTFSSMTTMIQYVYNDQSLLGMLFHLLSYFAIDQYIVTYWCNL
jgi:hypothetical protein